MHGRRYKTKDGGNNLVSMRGSVFLDCGAHLPKGKGTYELGLSNVPNTCVYLLASYLIRCHKERCAFSDPEYSGVGFTTIAFRKADRMPPFFRRYPFSHEDGGRWRSLAG